MSDKPLKTVEVEEILAAVYLAGTENGLSRSITDPKEIVHRREAFIKANPVCKEAKADLYQLMLSLVGEDELYYRPYLVATTKITTSQNQTQARMVLRNRNKLRAELRQKLSEHFNVEGGV